MILKIIADAVAAGYTVDFHPETASLIEMSVYPAGKPEMALSIRIDRQMLDDRVYGRNAEELIERKLREMYDPHWDHRARMSYPAWGS